MHSSVSLCRTAFIKLSTTQCHGKQEQFEVQPSQPPPLFYQQKLKQLTNGLYPKLIFTLFTRNMLVFIVGNETCWETLR